MNLKNYSISQMTINDLNSIKNILESDFDNFWNYNIFKSELENINSKYFLIKKDNTILGFIGCLFILNESEITNIVVKKDSRGNGISKILMTYLIDYCISNNIKKIHLEVSSKNITAINLYNHFNFKQVGLRKKYYIDSDAILFSKILS